MNPALLEIAEAIEKSEGRTPAEVIEAFLPVAPTACGQRLIPLTMGHDLFLTKLEHPLATGSANWTPADIAVALFTFTRPSRELFAMIDDGTYAEKFHAFLDEHAAGDLPDAATELLHHWFSRKSTAVGMESPHPVTQKKTAVSAGG
jgi:hypothetical protein